MSQQLTITSQFGLCFTISILVLFAHGSLTLAQEGPPADVAETERQSVRLTASTPAICKLGVSAPTAAVIDGALIDVSGDRIGRLRSNLGPYLIAVPGWCNAPSTLSIVAEPMIGPSFIDGTNTASFSRTVNFRARASGWTSVASVPETITNATRTGVNQPSQGFNSVVIPLPTEASITINLDQFATPADGRLVQGAYAGTVTITLGAN